MSGDESLSLELATVVEALCRVASLGRALRRSPFGAHYIGVAIEGSAACALQSVLVWTCTISSGPARKITSRIRASLGHGDRTLLGTFYAGGLVESGRRTLESDR